MCIRDRAELREAVGRRKKVAEKDCAEVGLAEKSEPTAGEKIENEKLEGVKVQEAIIKLKPVSYTHLMPVKSAASLTMTVP